MGDLKRRAELIRVIQAQGGVVPDRPRPVVSIEDFFTGNAEQASIGPNLTNHPGIAVFERVLRQLRERAEVQEVLLAIAEVVEEEGFTDWPFADVVIIMASSSAQEIAHHLRELRPDKVGEGWGPASRSPHAPEAQAGMQVFFAWWD